MIFPTHVPIPTHWTPEQAELVLDLVDSIHRAVWEQYGHRLVVQWACAPDDDYDEPPTDEFDDGPPF